MNLDLQEWRRQMHYPRESRTNGTKISVTYELHVILLGAIVGNNDRCSLQHADRTNRLQPIGNNKMSIRPNRTGAVQR